MARIKISGVPIEMPFEPYPAQIVTMTKLISCLTTGTSGLVESPTGTGKSLSIICAVLGYSEYLKRGAKSINVKRREGGSLKGEEAKEEKLKIIICSRTHKQLDQLIEQLRKTHYRPRISILASRSQYCISPKLGDVTDKNTGCNELVKSGSCAYFTGKDRLAKRVGDRIFDIEELKGEGRRCGGCPYYASRILNEDAEVIFAPYNYLIDSRIRENTGISLENSVVIVDEAHNIEDVCRSSGSIELSSRTIEIIQNEILGAIRRSGMLGEIKLDFVNLMDFFRKLREGAESTDGFDRTTFGGKLRIRKGKEIKDELEKMGITKEFVLKIKNSIYAIQKNEDAKDLLNMSTFHVLEGLDSVLSAIHFSGCDAYSFVFQKTNDENIRNSRLSKFSYNFWLLDAGYTFRSFVGKVRSIVLLSGTLTPFSSFSSELGHDFTHSIVAPHLVTEKQVFASCVRKGHLLKDLTGTYGVSDTPQYLDQLSRIIVDVSNKVKSHGGTLVFVPSYSFLENLQKRMGGESSGLLIEPKSGGGNEFEKVMKRYKNRIATKQRAIFMCVYRGKASEGIDFKDSFARAVIAVGIPYPSLHDPQVELKKEFNDRYKSFNGRLWYEAQAFRAVNQALGRAIRHKDDWGIVMLLDSRYSEKRVQTHLSKWVTDNIRVHDSYDTCASELSGFLSLIK
ncbi:Rad3/XPD ATP-dependent DNA-binding helicase [Encephalitozoon intestinalis ATCC 50506]|uniref:DNA 5'-3' helicase n=1 Tax=Encephalitozoon intestinalis (strain ATCC 50506) TaxID=876142 RepID=E0S5W7_ENCIT|nr:Rad3/XPD ATP-dependent DNA-binding helicase [Encephalitozoon intestinalis ATCC 50506]ADM11102.1 Rad3/XPD ATP-dependent DNA-binding helicase [Encephalitozoon intestinalis ATCC 50506]UTX44756.1 Rad3/XPD DNA repair helicase [Encephalitozoon intestinalis]